AAARRVFLEHVTAEIVARELGRAARSELLHPRRLVDARTDTDHAHEPGSALETNRFTRHTEAGFELGTHRHKLDEWTENIDEEVIALGAAVEATLLAERVGRDADANGRKDHG